jgi:Iap family predicted aminopeptidase
MFVCSLCNDAVSNLIYLALNNTEVNNAVFEAVLKEAIVIYYKLISWNLPQGAVENFDKPQLELLVAVPADFANRSRT